MIDEEQIRAVATDAAYKRGVRYFRRGAVAQLERQADGRSYAAVVAGTEAYHVRIGLTEAGRQLQQEVRECCLADNLRNQVDLADAELAQLKQLCDRISAQLGR